MVKINAPGSGHGNFTSAAGNHYWEYSNANALKILKQALFILENNVKGMRPCNKCFQKLPGGKTFDDVLADDTVWINYEARTGRGWYGITHSARRETSISQDAFNKGRWWVAGTLVHELAHINGASSTTKDADATLLCCGLKNAYEGVIGMNSGASSDYLV